MRMYATLGFVSTASSWIANMQARLRDLDQHQRREYAERERRSQQRKATVQHDGPLLLDEHDSTSPSVASATSPYEVSDPTGGGAPDGMTADLAGNLFATGPGGVWVFAPDGTHLGTIQPDEVPANVGWGEDGRTLYMTARTGLYRIRLTTEGPIL